MLGSGVAFYAKSLVAGFQLPLGVKKWGYGNLELFSSFILLGVDRSEDIQKGVTIPCFVPITCDFELGFSSVLQSCFLA
jgi:hypothetical protein